MLRQIIAVAKNACFITNESDTPQRFHRQSTAGGHCHHRHHRSNAFALALSGDAKRARVAGCLNNSTRDRELPSRCGRDNNLNPNSPPIGPVHFQGFQVGGRGSPDRINPALTFPGTLAATNRPLRHLRPNRELFLAVRRIAVEHLPSACLPLPCSMSSYSSCVGNKSLCPVVATRNQLTDPIMGLALKPESWIALTRRAGKSRSDARSAGQSQQPGFFLRWSSIDSALWARAVHTVRDFHQMTQKASHPFCWWMGTPSVAISGHSFWPTPHIWPSRQRNGSGINRNDHGRQRSKFRINPPCTKV